MGTRSPEATKPGDGRGFPLKPALALLVMAAVLAAWHWGKDRSKGLAPDIFAETFQLHRTHAPITVVPRKVERAVNGKLPPVSAVFVDDTDSLDPFYAALWKLEQSKQGQTGAAGLVTILHYGDSPTTADLITEASR